MQGRFRLCCYIIFNINNVYRYVIVNDNTIPNRMNNEYNSQYQNEHSKSVIFENGHFFTTKN